MKKAADPFRRDPVAFLADAHEGAVIAVVGAPQSGVRGAEWGKSRTVKAVDATGVWPRRVVFEPYGVRDRVEASRGRRLYPWPGRVVTVRQLVADPSILDFDPLSLVVVPDMGRGADLGRAFETVADLAWSTGGITVIGEEAALYARNALELCNRLATGGGHTGMRLVMIAQRWGRVPIDVRGCVSHLVAFAQAEDADVDALRKRCGRRFADEVQRLGVGARPLTWRLGDARE